MERSQDLYKSHKNPIPHPSSLCYNMSNMKSHILVSNGTRIFVSTLLFITLIIGTILASTKTKANVVMNEVSLAIPVSCSMSSTISTGNDHIATIVPNSYTENIGITNLKALCNDFSGFSIYAIGYTNNTDGNNTMLGTNTNQTIATGTNSSGNASNWSMKLTKVENPTNIENPTGTGGGITYNPDNLSILDNYDSYHTVPNTLTKVAEYKASTGSSTTDQTLGSNIQTTYAAFISSTQSADTYIGKVKYLLLHPATLVAGNYTIAYNANGGTGTMNSETNVKNYEPHTLALNTFTAPTGYVFSGWCTIQDANATSTNPQTTCDSESYRDGATISSSPSISATDGGTLTLYAYWQRPYTMQQFANGTADTTCTKLNIGERVTLIDARDSQEYTVAKLKDNKCWMTKNLNIAGGTALSSSDTDVDASYIDSFTTSNNLTKTNDTIVLPASNAGGFTTNNYSYVYNTGNNTDTCTTPGCYSYYSWDAATLGSGRSLSTDNTDAPYSICPKGWRLPTSGSPSNDGWKRGDFYALAISYGANLENSYIDNSSVTGKNFYNNAGPIGNSTPNFLLAGYYYNSSFNYGGYYGYYWSATSGNTGARRLGFGPSEVYSAYGSSRRDGFSVRCLTEETVNDLTYMQDFASLTNDTKNRIINNMKTEETHTLKDKRDNQDYTIAKLKDGKVWMTKNLNLAGGTTLSSGDTDFAPDYTLPTTNGWTTTDNGAKLVMPTSSISGFSASNYAYVFNSNNITVSQSDCTYGKPCNSYYSWDAATLGSGRTISTDNTDAPYSICPKGWYLPSTYNGINSSTDFRALAIAYGGSESVQTYNDSTLPTGATMYSKIGSGAVPNFLLAGYCGDNSFSVGGNYGSYWSSTSYNNTNARFLNFNSSYMRFAAYDIRGRGLPIRCLVK